MQANEIEGFLKQMKLAFPETEGKILLLMLVAVLYPLYAFYGVQFHAPLFLRVCNEVDAERLIQILTGFGIPPVLSFSASPKELQNVLDEIEYGNVVFRWNIGRYTTEHLQRIRDTAANLNYEILLLIVSVNDNPLKFADAFEGEIYLEEESASGVQIPRYYEFIRELIAYSDQFQIELRCWITEIKDSIGVFEITARLLLKYLKYAGVANEKAEEYKNVLISALQRIEQEWDGDLESEVISEVFQKSLFTVAEGMPGISDRNRISGEDWKRIEEIILFDDQFYYITEELFKEVCDSFCEHVSASDMKRYLEDAGMLVCEGRTRKYGTVKICIVSVYGEIDRVRRVKL